ncbi:MAG: hypothetical protein AB7T14_10245 [Candidatus Methylacidiphilaceae bacterium]
MALRETQAEACRLVERRQIHVEASLSRGEEPQTPAIRDPLASPPGADLGENYVEYRRREWRESQRLVEVETRGREVVLACCVPACSHLAISRTPPSPEIRERRNRD